MIPFNSSSKTGKINPLNYTQGRQWVLTDKEGFGMLEMMYIVIYVVFTQFSAI